MIRDTDVYAMQMFLMKWRLADDDSPVAEVTEDSRASNHHLSQRCRYSRSRSSDLD